MNRLSMLLSCFLLAAFCLIASGIQPRYRIAEEIPLDKVPSWFPVGFSLFTHDGAQFAAYYNEKHQMVVARRQLDQAEWRKVELPSKVGWDSHNYITMAVDEIGNLHLSGNMHCVPLVYFRTEEPGNITTFKRLPMTGEKESRCTYPRFIDDADGNLLFMYRDGGSGNGRRYYNQYDVESRTWLRFLETPLFEGHGRRNAYPHGPKQMADGRFHVAWVWRETPDCATNHDLSYARSSDLKNWETAVGQPVDLPLTLEQTELIVDPVPVDGGIINGCEHLFLDSNERPIISYHKLDEEGHMQIYVARFENGKWRRRAITDWKKNITFGGGGAMPFIGIRISGLSEVTPGTLSIGYRHRDYGSGTIVLDEETLATTSREVTVRPEYPGELQRPTIDFEGIRVKLAGDLGAPPNSDTKYVLRWETLGANHDRPRQPPLPPPSELKLIRLERN
jgi:hypothetical protein